MDTSSLQLAAGALLIALAAPILVPLLCIEWVLDVAVFSRLGL